MPSKRHEMPATQIPLKIVNHDEFCIEAVPDPFTMVIFGASGDLTRRKLIPALQKLDEAKLLTRGFAVLGFSRTPMDDAVFRETLRAGGTALPGNFTDRFHYVPGDYNDPVAYRQIAARIRELDERFRLKGNVLFYLATPPDLTCRIIKQLAAAGLIHPPKKNTWCHVIIEKPFGHDLDSARALNNEIHRYLEEPRIYRIDHYLGKETVQNIFMFRFANTVFEPLWNRQYIDNVQITVSESLGVGHRAGYYENAGVVRDMFQNHMLQLLSLVAMEPPVNFTAEEYRDEKAKVLRSLRPLPLNKLDEFAVRGQYGAGEINGGKVPAYRDEKNVAPGSATETFAAMKSFIDNSRWQDVPFYLRSGKRLARPVSEINIQFKQVPHSIFAKSGIPPLPANVLSLKIQPEEGIALSFEAKHPGPKICIATLDLTFNYGDTFNEEAPGAYERLLLDCMQGDSTLFLRQDMVDLSWSFLKPVLDVWKQKPPAAFPNYPAGSWGPREAVALIERGGRKWMIQ